MCRFERFVPTIIVECRVYIFLNSYYDLGKHTSDPLGEWLRAHSCRLMILHYSQEW